ncbi:MAG TPA: catalase, partial [Flavobacteriales bacterium]|nr:catalase [Flavobacteriales bacterium]
MGKKRKNVERGLSGDYRELKQLYPEGEVKADYVLKEKSVRTHHASAGRPSYSAAYGYFQLYDSVGKYTTAKFLNDTSITTPVFVRFSTVIGAQGFHFTNREASEFSVKFYTEEGIVDVPGANVPVSYTKDALRFREMAFDLCGKMDKPDFSLQDAYWEIVGNMPQSIHRILWNMSDRTLPRSFRMMEGFGKYPFVFTNALKELFFVKFHWRPMLGVHAITGDEARKISEMDPEYYRRDLWESIHSGFYPEWELGVQVIPFGIAQEFKNELTDSTRIIPKELVPLEIIGKLVLDRNPDNFLTEAMQIEIGHDNVIPGIDSMPISKTDRYFISEAHETTEGQNVLRMIDGLKDPLLSINKIKLNGGHSYREALNQSRAVQIKLPGYHDHFVQACMFYNRQDDSEKRHMVESLFTELHKVTSQQIRETVIRHLSHIDVLLAARVAYLLGMDMQVTTDMGISGKTFVHQAQSIHIPECSATLSLETMPLNCIRSRRVAILAASGVDGFAMSNMRAALDLAGAITKIISLTPGSFKDSKGKEVRTDETFLTTSSVFFDAVYVPGGFKSVLLLKAEQACIHFVNEAYRHGKTIASENEGTDLISTTMLGSKVMSDGSTIRKHISDGIIINGNAKDFINAISMHRFWDRE